MKELQLTQTQLLYLKELLESKKARERFENILQARSFCAFLESSGIFFDLCIKHPIAKACYESEQYYQKYQYLMPEYSVCKHLLVQERKGEKRKFLIIVDSHKQVDMAQCKIDLETKKLEFVNDDGLEELLHTKAGNISIFNMMYDVTKQIELVIDEELLQKDCLVFHPLYNELSIFIKPEEFLKFLELIQREAKIMEIASKEVCTKQKMLVRKN